MVSAQQNTSKLPTLPFHYICLNCIGKNSWNVLLINVDVMITFPWNILKNVGLVYCYGWCENISFSLTYQLRKITKDM